MYYFRKSVVVGYVGESMVVYYFREECGRVLC